MKYLFFIAVLVNLAFFLWELQSGGLAPRPGDVSNSEPDNKQIWLLSELKTESVPTGTEQIAPDQSIVVQNDVPVDLTVGEKGTLVDVLVAQDAQNKPGVIEALESEKRDEDVDVLADKPDEPASVVDHTVFNKEDESTDEDLTNNNTDRSKPVLSQTVTTEADSVVAEDGEVINPEVPEANTVQLKLAEELVKPGAIIPDATMNSAEQCVEVGPFINKASVVAWFNSSVSDGREKEIYAKEIEEISNYLVYFPAADSYQESKANVAMLQQKGITDMWLFRRGDMKGAISLGMFRQKARADKLKAIMQRKNLDVSIVERFQTQRRWFIRLHGAPVKVHPPLVASHCVE